MSKKFIILSVALLSFAGLVLTSTPAQAGGYCFCASPLDTGVTPEELKDAKNSGCNTTSNEDACKSTAGTYEYINDFDSCKFFDGGIDDGYQRCKDALITWDAHRTKLTKDVSSTEANTSAFLPACILANEFPKDSPCRDFGIFVLLGINIANYLFGIIGALALLMFIYGGILFIISEGNPERVKKGTDAMLAAIIGIIVVFSAYLLVGFLSEAVGVGSLGGVGLKLK